MAPVARELSAVAGALEPLQTAMSLDGQVAELSTILERDATPPVTLIGASWGAWLSLIVAAGNPSLVRKLIVVGSGPFEDRYAERILPTRLARLNEDERREVQALLDRLSASGSGNEDGSLARLGTLLATTDAYDPLPVAQEPVVPLEGQGEVYRRVWSEASDLRRSGRLLELAAEVRCPVLAIHGDYDPHPYEGVRDPLARIVRDFRFVLLEKCGHEPWIERHAKDRFYDILKQEFKSDEGKCGWM
jgi:pimeloyl-ACP methyl ester carboxylesterase